MKAFKVAVVVLILLALVSCATLAPFTGTDYRQISQILKPYQARWGDYGYVEVHLQADRTQAWIGFLWLEKDVVVHALLVGYIGDGWIVVQER
jgi:hypothetical protein